MNVYNNQKTKHEKYQKEKLKIEQDSKEKGTIYKTKEARKRNKIEKQFFCSVIFKENQLERLQQPFVRIEESIKENNGKNEKEATKSTKIQQKNDKKSKNYQPKCLF